jgi:3-methyl-2-oxobutanoate hydroxymethyltransferase
MAKKVTVPDLIRMKKEGRRISTLTAYDFTLAKILDQAGVDVILVGDSLGMVIQGRKNTLGVTLDDMIYHSRCVSKALSRAHLVCDMPFLSYQASVEEAVRNCGKVLKNGRAEAVKLEGGEEIAPTVKRLTELGIPVMGHIGLKPMYVHAMGGYKIQGADASSGKKILKDAKALEKAGAYSLVLEGIPAALAARITRSLKIPTIGIGSGPHCDGQVLVVYDLLGMYQEIQPKFVRKYARLFETITDSVKKYIEDVQSGGFPGEKESF